MNRSLRQRIDALTDKKSGPIHPTAGRCWVWVRSSSKQWYLWVNGKMVRSHRISWMLEFGAIPDEQLVLHKCDNPSCVRPSHLFLGTYKDNSQDMMSKGRGKQQITGQDPAVGEDHPNCKLTIEQVLSILSWKPGNGTTQKQEVASLGISLSHFQNIRSGNVWKHLSRGKR